MLNDLEILYVAYYLIVVIMEGVILLVDSDTAKVWLWPHISKTIM